MSCPSSSAIPRSRPVTDLLLRPVAIYVQPIDDPSAPARHGTERLRLTPSPWYITRMVQDLVATLEARAPEVVRRREQRMRSQRFDFPGAAGQRLSGRLDAPDGPTATTALFAHCFTCGKDVLAAARIARRLAELGIATLRFDFTGLGGSGGEFANSTFTANVDDLVAAAAALRRAATAPALLVGHSLGGAAMLAAAERIPGGAGS